MPNSEGVAFESDPQVFELTKHNLGVIGQSIRLFQGDYVRLLEQCRIPDDRGIVGFAAPPWGTALDEMYGLDLRLTTPPITEIIEKIARQFPKHKMLFATQVYEKISAASLSQIQIQLDWSELRIYEVDKTGRNHGILLGTRGWSPR